MTYFVERLIDKLMENDLISAKQDFNRAISEKVLAKLESKKVELSKKMIVDDEDDLNEALPPHLQRHFDDKGKKIEGEWIKTKDGKRTWVPLKKQKTKRSTSRDVTPKGYGPDEDVEENSAFMGKAAAAKKDGKKKFKLGDKEFPVTMKKSTAEKILDESSNNHKFKVGDKVKFHHILMTDKFGPPSHNPKTGNFTVEKIGWIKKIDGNNVEVKYRRPEVNNDMSYAKGKMSDLTFVSGKNIREEFELDESTNQKIQKLRKIVDTSQNARIDGQIVDLFTASAIIQVYDAVNDVNKEKLAALSIPKMSDVAFKLINRMKKESIDENQGVVRWQDAEEGDFANVIKTNKTGVIVKAYGKRFHLKFPDGNMKTYDQNELSFIRSESIDETVSSSSKDIYRSATGKKPSGKGKWVFSTVKPSQHDIVKHKDQTFISPPFTSFVDAAKLANKHFKEKGHKGEIHVLS